MSQTVIATYEDGVLRPSEPLDLLPQAQVQLTIVPVSKVQPSTGNEPTAVEKRAALIAYWNNMRPFISSEPHLTRDELHERR